MGVKNYGLVTSVDELEELCLRLLKIDAPIGIDIETGYSGPDQPGFSLHPETAFVVGISLTHSTDWARYVPLAHDCGGNLDNDAAARLLWPVLATGHGVAHHAAFEARHLSRWFTQHLADDPEYGPEVQADHGYFPFLADSMVEAYLAAEYQRFGLKFLVEAIFGHKMTELHELFGENLTAKQRKTLRFNVLDPTDVRVYDYACEDAAWCLALHQRYYAQVRQDRKLLLDVEHFIATVVVPRMEDFGVAYDWPAMETARVEADAFRDRLNAEIMAELSEMVGEQVAINIGSPAQLSKVLFEQLGLRTTVYTAKTRNLPPEQRRMSTGKIALERLAKKHPVIKKIRSWKELAKLSGTYLKKYAEQYNYAPDGRTHPNHLSAFVVTGRFAVSDPPYQQSPKKYHFDLIEGAEAHAAHADAHGPKCACDDPAFAPPAGTCFKYNFRNSIIAPPEHYILGFDLSQAELRAIAGEAQEHALLRAFEAGEDVHVLTAALMLQIPIDQVGPDQRAVGKTQNFALLYRMGIKSLADRLGLPIEEAKVLYGRYFAVFPAIATWSARQIQLGKTLGYVTSRFGRKLPIWEYQADQEWIRQKGDRACVNYPIQGAATGDFVKIGMVRAHLALRDAGLLDRVHLVMNIHDALEFYVHASVMPDEVIRVLQPAVVFPVPGTPRWPAMQAEWHMAKRWGSPVELTVTDDGRVFADTSALPAMEESMPVVEVDEDSGEEIVEFDDGDVAAVHRVVASDHWAGVRGTGRTVIVALSDMPEVTAWEGFKAMLRQRPGADRLVLRTPEGDLPVELPDGTDLHPGDVAAVSLLLGPVRIHYDGVDVDAAQLASQLQL